MITIYGLWNMKREQWYWIYHRVFTTPHRCVAMAQRDFQSREYKRTCEVYGWPWDESEVYIVKVIGDNGLPAGVVFDGKDVQSGNSTVQKES